MQNVLYILESLSDDDIDWIVACSSRKEIPANTVLIQQGKTEDALYIVLKGIFSVCVSTVVGIEKEIARLNAGDVVGEMSFIDSRPPSATVKAVSDCLVLSIPRQELTAKLQLDITFSSRFYRALVLLLSSRLRGTVHQLGEGKAEIENLPTDDLKIAQARFDWLLRRLGSG